MPLLKHFNEGGVLITFSLIISFSCFFGCFLAMCHQPEALFIAAVIGVLKTIKSRRKAKKNRLGSDITLEERRGNYLDFTKCRGDSNRHFHDDRKV